MYASYQYRVVCWFALLSVLALTGGRLEAQPVFNPANGHYYEGVDLFFPPMGVEWPEANDIATAATHMATEGPLTGELLIGHLVTITSADEQAFLEANILPIGDPFTDYWIGCMQSLGETSPGAGWQWVTCEPFEYTNWSPDEPNDSNGGENNEEQFMELRAPPGNTTWNDNGVRNKSYIIEYDGLCDPETECDDGQDNDEDGDIDCVDSDCAEDAACPEICGNFLDDDSDGLVDCEDTEECSAEATCAEVCDDGMDNDYDGDVDCFDADCEGNPICPRPVPSGYRVDFNGRPAPPLVGCFDNSVPGPAGEWLWDIPEPGFATMRTNIQQSPVRSAFCINATNDRSPVPGIWDPSVPGDYEVTCMVVGHTAGLAAAGLDLFWAERDWSWTVGWTEFFVSLDIGFEQIEVPDTADAYSFEMDTTDDFHCYRVEWDPDAPIAKLWVDDEDTGIFLDDSLLASSRGRIVMVLGDAYAGTTGGEVIFDSYSFTPTIPVEICDNEIDDDGDGDIDCADVDCDGNEACGPGPFLRGDCDGNGNVGGTPTEAVVGLNHTFRGGPAPPCLAACDAEANGTLGITDYVRILRFSFAGGAPPDAPFPDCVTSNLAGDVALGCETPICPP